MADKAVHISEAYADLGPTQRSPLSAPPPRPSARTVEIMGKLGLRYPPASSVDRDAHAARVALLAEDCADLDPDWLDAAAREWAKTEPFMPRACELRELTMIMGRITRRDRILPPPPRPEPKPEKPVPPLTEAEIRKLPRHLIDMGVKLGEIDQALADSIRGAA
jgi:hypothetical protein